MGAQINVFQKCHTKIRITKYEYKVQAQSTSAKYKYKVHVQNTSTKYKHKVQVQVQVQSRYLIPIHAW